MKLRQILDCVHLLDASEVRDRESALGGILRKMGHSRVIEPAIVPEILASVMRREELGPTGIGEGVAIPHSWHPAVEQIRGALAVAPDGVDFGSLDGQPVRIIVLLVTPLGPEGERLKSAAFETILRHLRSEGTRHRLGAATSTLELREIVNSLDPEEP